MKRILAIDFGLKRIGLAITDDRQKIALPLGVVEGGKKRVENIRKALKGKEIEKIIVGLPLLLNGREGDMAILVKAFAAELEQAFGVPVQLVDERLSSKMADRSLSELQLTRKKRTEQLDTTAATLLLQMFLF